MSKFSKQQEPTENGLVINDSIRAKEVRLIDDEGNNQGIVALKKAIMLAKDKGFDLVEINSKTSPPICKFLDYDKYRYEIKKKEQEQKKANKVLEDKEIRLTPNISDFDLEIKSRKAIEFLNEGRKVALKFKLKGREKFMFNETKMVTNKFYDLVKDKCRLDKIGDSYILVPA